MIGKTIGHYKIVDKLGEGGMGAVYKAEDTTLRRLVALKALSSQLAENEEARERFVREAQAASSLNHSNITTVHELLEDEGEQFIVMEYIEGKTIRDILESGHVSIRKAVDIILQAAEALDAAHRKGILHRDVKSANIMVSMEGNVKVMDFGLAYLEDRSQLTRTGTTMGTLAYSSPEQLTGRPYDERSEIWSLGVVFYELLSGQLPFKSPSEGELVFAIINNEQDKPSKLNEDVPGSVEAVVTRMLEKNLEQRYLTCGELINDLKAIQGELETTTVAITTTLRPRSESRKKRAVIGVVAALVVIVGAILFFSGVFSSKATKEIRIAVMPFENQGPPEDEFLADGIAVEIRSKLQRLQGLLVISRSSTDLYKTITKTTQDIGRELDADFLLNGMVQWRHLESGPSTVQIIPELIRVSDDAQLWSHTYNQDYSEIGRIQLDIVEQIVQQLDVVLLVERATLAEMPTENVEAYQAYLKGREHLRRENEEDVRLAIQLFERAVELDLNFAKAYAELSVAHSALYHYGFDRSERRQTLARNAAIRVSELAPDAPETYRALGFYYYWALRDYEKALENFKAAERIIPNDGGCQGIIAGIGFVLRRQGQFEVAQERLLRALELSPRDAVLAHDIGLSYSYMRQYSKAEEYYNLSLSLDPDYTATLARMPRLYVVWKGSLEDARAALMRWSKVVNNSSPISYHLYKLLLFEGNYQQALEHLSSSPFESLSPPETLLSYPIALLSAQIYQSMGNPQLARASYDQARMILEGEKEERPEAPGVQITLGLAYAGLDREEDAIREGKLVVDELFPISHDALRGTPYVEELARIYTMVGRYDAAVDQLEYLLSIPSLVSVPLLRIDPTWDPLRDQPRFQELLRKYKP